MSNILIGVLLSLIVLGGFFLAWKKFIKGVNTHSLLLILFCGLILRLFIASDQYVHEWDESFHAVVAKNLLKHPFKPTLYDDPLLTYDYRVWTGNHIWLSKQIVPLWNMAISIRLFGNNEFSLRIPSVVVSTICIYFTYLLGLFLFSRKVGLLAAFLHAINGSLMELAGGRISSDHVETFFLFFFELAILFFLLYFQKTKHNKLYLIGLGVSVGLAFMCKWTPALFIIPIWVLTSFWKRVPIKTMIVDFGILLFSLIIISLPWQLYILMQYPVEAQWMYNAIFTPLTQVLENHDEPFYYYFIKIGQLFGMFVYLPLLLCLIDIIRRKSRWKLVLLCALCLVPFLVFSLASTKRYTYILISCPAFFLLIAYYWMYFKSILPRVKYKWLIFLFLMFLLFIPTIKTFEAISQTKMIESSVTWVNDLKSMNNMFPEEKVAVFNIRHHIEAMYYTNYIVYQRLPAKDEIQSIIDKGYRIIINDDGKLPDYLLKNIDVELIKLTEFVNSSKK